MIFYLQVSQVFHEYIIKFIFHKFSRDVGKAHTEWGNLLTETEIPLQLR